VLSSLLYIHLIWLALPIAFLLIQSFITLWLPGESWIENIWQQESLLARDINTLTVSALNTDDKNCPTFENYQHIKKILASHKKRFPNAKVNNIHTMYDTKKQPTSSPHSK